jgi:hypothetical protein
VPSAPLRGCGSGRARQDDRDLACPRPPVALGWQRLWGTCGSIKSLSRSGADSLSSFPDWNWSLIGGFFAGAFGVGFGIWNGVDRWRDRKWARAVALPKVEALPSTLNEGEWTFVRFRFSSPREARFDVAEIRCVGPAEFAETLPPPPDEKLYDPSPPGPDLTKITGRKQVGMLVDIDLKQGFTYSGDCFWVRVSARGKRRKPASIYMACHQRFNKSAKFTLRCDL